MCAGVYTGIVWNEWIHGYANVVRTSSSFCTHTHTPTHSLCVSHTHILITFEDCELTGLKVDIAGESAHQMTVAG